MGSIVRLSSHLANMIAAGEVVERPMSVVKELVENSMDAKANKIEVYLKDSGTTSIKVIDNGTGMSSEDIEMSFYRHATSKIKSEYDLFRIHTLGFRGEAIPSIASVSLMKISSNEGSGGYQVTYKAGNLIDKGEEAMQKGTVVSVSNLFYNTPARLKYLKSLQKELAVIAVLMDKLALAHPDVSFTLYNDDKLLLKTNGNNDRVALMGEIYGLQAAKNLIFKTYDGNGYTLDMILVKPEVYRTSRNEVTLICNGRYVRSNAITNAVIEGYRTYIPIGKNPVVVIYLSIDPLLVDCNVHPAKTEIKISNEEILVEMITKIVKETLESTVQIPSVEASYVAKKSYQKESIFDIDVAPVYSNSLYNNGNTEIKYLNEDKNEEYTNVQNDIAKADGNSDLSLKSNDINPNESSNKENLVEDENISTEAPLKEVKQDSLPYFEYVGQIHGTYLIFQNSDGMFLMDQHAAAERIRYEYFYELLGNPPKVHAQLLIPIIMDFTKEEKIFIDMNLNTFNELGFSLEEASNQSYFIREVPAWVSFDNADDTIRYIIKLMIENHKIEVAYFRDAIAKQISCKGAIKANKRISMEEINKLLEDLRKCKNPYHCPHGRPTIIKITNLELEKMFQRVL